MKFLSSNANTTIWQAAKMASCIFFFFCKLRKKEQVVFVYVEYNIIKKAKSK